MKVKLNELNKNQIGKIVQVFGNIHTRRRLYELGFLNGQNIKILFVSQKNNSYIIEINNYTIALRKNILENILVEII